MLRKLGFLFLFLVNVSLNSGCNSGFTDQNEIRQQALDEALDSVFTIFPSTGIITINGSISFSLTNGQPPYHFTVLSKDSFGNPVGTVVTTGAKGTYIAGSSNGSAIVQATDSLGHTAVATIIINNALALSLTDQWVMTGTTATVPIVADSGVSPLTYSISTTAFGTINSNSGLFTAGNSIGTATVTVTDSSQPPNSVNETMHVYGPLTLAPNAGANSPDSDPVIGQTSFGILLAGGAYTTTPVFKYCTGSSQCPSNASVLTLSSSSGGVYRFAPMTPAGTYNVCTTDIQSNIACTPVIVHNVATMSAHGIQIFPGGSPATCTSMAIPNNNPVQITTANSINMSINDAGYAVSQTYNLTPTNPAHGALAGITLNPTTATHNLAEQVQITGAAFVAGLSFLIHAQNTVNPSQSVDIPINVVALPMVTPTNYPDAVQSGETQLFTLSGGVGPYCAPTSAGSFVANVSATNYTFAAGDRTTPVAFYDSLGNLFNATQANSTTFTGLTSIDTITNTSLVAHYDMTVADNTQSDYSLTIAALGNPSYPPSNSNPSSDYSYTLSTTCARSCTGSSCSCTFSNLSPGVAYQVSITYSGSTTSQTASTSSLAITEPSPGISVTSPGSNQINLQWQKMTNTAGVTISGYAIYYGQGAQNNFGGLSTLVNISTGNSSLTCNSTKCNYLYSGAELVSNTPYTFSVLPIVNGVMIGPNFQTNAIQFPNVPIQ